VSRLPEEEAARLAGIDRSYYGRIERGSVNVSTVNLLKIAEMLHADVGRFFPVSSRPLGRVCAEPPGTRGQRRHRGRTARQTPTGG
jgi:transcriptional regulator with XRE-family HTH domain